MRMVGVKLIVNDTDFQPELSAVGSRLAVVKFTMRGCGPCLRIAPAFNALSNKYLQAMFLEVDVHQCQMDLMPFINKAGCECLNESDEHGFDNCLRKDSTYLESDCDEQLLITVAFSQPVKLYSMKLQGPDNGQGPKYVKIFINLPRSMDFEEAETSEPTQALELTPDDIKEDGIVQLRYVKFQNVNCVTLFVQSNHGDEEATRITYLTFIGTPVQATNMNDFKRVSLCFFKALMNVLNLPKNEPTEQIHSVVVVTPLLKVDLASKTKHVALSYSSLVLPSSFLFFNCFGGGFFSCLFVCFKENK
ncbi:thioredoxin-like protein 1 isoform X3 [Meleagris gallopavo]|uniref:thioredoxin-like protein 1 isoform X3 n=1 Tax=Meleagris gallopavo TaxID=9103 RepID=UPI000549C236|nr:thioredoxin-like protein 1 isoform X3 [Meleagris gallopavo]